VKGFSPASSTYSVSGPAWVIAVGATSGLPAAGSPVGISSVSGPLRLAAPVHLDQVARELPRLGRLLLPPVADDQVAVVADQ